MPTFFQNLLDKTKDFVSKFKVPESELASRANQLGTLTTFQQAQQDPNLTQIPAISQERERARLGGGLGVQDSLLSQGPVGLPEGGNLQGMFTTPEGELFAARQGTALVGQGGLGSQSTLSPSGTLRSALPPQPGLPGGFNLRRRTPGPPPPPFIPSIDIDTGAVPRNMFEFTRPAPPPPPSIRPGFTSFLQDTGTFGEDFSKFMIDKRPSGAQRLTEEEEEEERRRREAELAQRKTILPPAQEQLFQAGAVPAELPVPGAVDQNIQNLINRGDAQSLIQAIELLERDVEAKTQELLDMQGVPEEPVIPTPEQEALEQANPGLRGEIDNMRRQAGLPQIEKQIIELETQEQVLLEKFQQIVDDIESDPELPKSLAKRRIAEFEKTFGRSLNRISNSLKRLGTKRDQINDQIDQELGIIKEERAEEERTRDNTRQFLQQLISTGGLANLSGDQVKILARDLQQSEESIKALQSAVSKPDVDVRGSIDDGFVKITTDSQGNIRVESLTQPRINGVSSKTTQSFQEDAADLFLQINRGGMDALTAAEALKILYKNEINQGVISEAEIDAIFGIESTPEGIEGAGLPGEVTPLTAEEVGSNLAKTTKRLLGGLLKAPARIGETVSNIEKGAIKEIF